MTDSTIGVLGPTGTIGRRVVMQLREAGYPVRALSRGGDIGFDWHDSTTWSPALDGVARLFLMAPDGVAVDPEFVGCAVGHGVEHVVLLSSRAIEAMGDERLLAAESTVRDSGMPWTIVRPSWFNQNFDEGFFREAVLAGELTLPVGGLRQAFVDADDIAAVVVAALTDDGHAGRSYELTGPTALSFAEALSVIGRALGRQIRFVGTAEEYHAFREALGVGPDEIDAEIAAFAALKRQGDDQPNDVIRRVAYREPISFEAYVAEAMERDAWRV